MNKPQLKNEKKSSVKLGQVYRYTDTGVVGYYVVTKIENSIITCTSLFWSKDLVYNTYQEKTFLERFTPFDMNASGLSPSVRAMFDYQLIRRLSSL